MMLGVTAEQIAGWDAEPSSLTGSLGYLFNRPEPRAVFAQFIEGLLAELPKKNGWTLSERAGHVTADRMQWLLNGSVWDADRLRDAVRDYVITYLGCKDASLVIDDTQAQKMGTKSVGVAFQHCGLTGDVRNCQTMVMLTYATAAGHAFIDRRLSLPEEWTNDRDRCREAGVPDEIAFATKPELAITMLERARAAHVPFSWVLADAGYGRDPQLRAWCHGHAVPYVFGVPVDLPIDGPPGKPRQPAVKRADDLLHYAKVRDQWERRSCGDGAKGERLYDWSAFAVQVKMAGFFGSAHRDVVAVLLTVMVTTIGIAGLWLLPPALSPRLLMRLVWLAAISVLAVVMAVFTPYVLRTESMWQAAAWLVMLAATVTGIAALIRAELLLRRLERQRDPDVPGT
ncbi:IS701 family transposase [Streptomyces sp. NPDC008222]|uniref:IS701 family transposase n=1 Tax=Streptomyces sp. NPDC008222 TaxID=3364820 RepID=UPI0036EDA46C